MGYTLTKTLTLLALLATLGLLAGCGDDANVGDAGVVQCTGETVTIGGETYCVYQSDVVVEEGFRCPDAAPHLIEQGGVGICSPSEELTDERIGEIADAYDRQVEPENNGVQPENNGQEPENNGVEPVNNGIEPENNGIEPENNGVVSDPASIALCERFCDRIEACGMFDDEGFSFGADDVAGCKANCPNIGPAPAGFEERIACAEAATCGEPVVVCLNTTITPEAVAACLADNAEPLDPDEVLYERRIAGGPNNSEQDQVIEVTAALIQQECEDQGGTDCDLTAWINREAAECVAAAAGLEEGVEPWMVELRYPGGENMTAYWWIRNVLSRTEGGGMAGRTMYVLATTGELIGLSRWGANP